MQTALLRLPQVRSKTGLSRSEVYRREKLGEFPRRVSLGARSVGWLAEEVDAWIMERVRESRNGGATK